MQQEWKLYQTNKIADKNMYRWYTEHVDINFTSINVNLNNLCRTNFCEKPNSRGKTVSMWATDNWIVNLFTRWS